MTTEAENSASIAAVEKTVEYLVKVVDEIKADNERRAAKQSADHRATMEKLEAINQNMAKQQGFLNGAAFVVKVFWAGVGVFGAGLLYFLKTGELPPFK